MRTVKEHVGRFVEIDVLRGLSIFVMVLIHTNTYFLINKLAYITWDLSQFAVPVFIFCSAYLFFQRSPNFKNLKELFLYIKKRFFLLLIPYYLFLSFWLLFVYLKEPTKITFSYLWQNILVVGGVDINWLILLFLIFSFIMSLISYLARRKKLLFCLYLAFSLAGSVWLIFFHFPFNYRLIMWLPWSLVVIFSWCFVRYEKAHRFLPIGLVLFLAVFVALRFVETTLHKSLVMYDNKYPPNLYHLSYGIASILFLFFLAKRGSLSFFPVKNLLNFLSVHSYSLYFIHYLLIFVITVFFKFQFNWVSFFVTIFILSLIVQSVLNFVLNMVRYVFQYSHIKKLFVSIN